MENLQTINSDSEIHSNAHELKEAVANLVHRVVEQRNEILTALSLPLRLRALALRVVRKHPVVSTLAVTAGGAYIAYRIYENFKAQQNQDASSHFPSGSPLRLPHSSRED